ncbi:MAG: hypothetical protein BGP16_05450 [Sphingobium sp. 66-54]|nr:MAG: hypothetical protein BGP16_05450 [Sphingobium sp. 66-54]
MFNTMTATGKRLVKAMEMRGIDQSTLARGLGVTQGAISKIVVGRTSNSRLMPRLATYLGVSLPWLLGVVDSPDPDVSIEDGLDAESLEFLEQFHQLAPADRRALMHIARSMAGGVRPSETVHEAHRGYRGRAEN